MTGRLHNNGRKQKQASCNTDGSKHDSNDLDGGVRKKGDSGTDSRVSRGDRENGRDANGKSSGKRPKNMAEKLRDAAVLNAVGTAASHAVKTALLLKLKIKLQMLVQQAAHIFMHTSAGVIISLCILIGAAIVAVIDNAASVSSARKDSNFVECTAYIDRAMIGKGGYGTVVDVNNVKRQTAKRIYSVYFHYGLRPEQIFAVLGNWELESGIDPTAVETVFTEPYRIGMKKQQAVQADFVLEKWNPRYAATYPDILRNGIGLGQWTNDRNKKLVAYAKLYGMQDFKGDSTLESMWYDLNVQLAFSIDTSSVGDSKASWFDSWKAVGAEEWDGDIKADLEFTSKNKWDTVDTVNGLFDDETISLHPVGEDNSETTIGSDSKDDYYDDADRNDANIQATVEMNAAWPAILAAHKPVPYTDSDGIYHDGIAEANDAAKKEYIKKWKKKYRFYLYKFTVVRYTKQFAGEWEGCNNGTEQARINNALGFFYEWWDEADKDAGQGEPNYFVGADNATDSNDYFFYVEEGYAGGVLAVLNKTKDYNNSISKIYTYDQDMSLCNRIVYEERKSIAKCAAMIAWPTIAQSRGNDGTELYKWVHDQVIKGDNVYMSCDRTVCTAVRWSGYDDSYPKGATLNQIQYLVTSPRWVELDWGGDKSQLQAGDVLIRKDSGAGDATAETGSAEHHTLIYTGEVIAKNYSDKSLGSVEEGSCIVHGSYGERSPGIGTWSEKYSTYHAYRCIHPLSPTKSEYKKISIPPGIK